jgi:glutaredoxin
MRHAPQQCPRRRPSLVAAILTTLLALAFQTGCGDPDPRDHYDRAVAIEREVLRRNPEAGYGHPGYVSVLRELDRVGRSAPERGRARMFAQRISDGRRFAAMERYPQIDHLPRRLRGTEAPAPPKPGERSTTPAARQTLQAAAQDALGELTSAEKRQLDITMYSTSWCGYCSKARRWFGDRGWPLVEKNIEEDPDAADEYHRVAGKRGGVPVIVINGEVLRGFDPGAIERTVARLLRGG